MHEINKVNPNLHLELRSLIKNDQLTQKFGIIYIYYF